jgi:hypothetical protein
VDKEARVTPKPEEDFTRDELLAIWEAGEPVAPVSVSEIRHSTLCALTATGHRGPCTCGAVTPKPEQSRAQAAA